jgi:hypothetical protein
MPLSAGTKFGPYEAVSAIGKGGMDGKEILIADPGKIWSVRVEGSGEQMRFSMPEPLFSAQPPSGTNSGSRPLAVNRDGTRIYYLQSVDEPDSGVINVRTGAIR